MEKTFGNKCNYNTMIRTLYEVQQKEDKMVEEYMLCIHDAVTVIHRAYPEHLPDQGEISGKTASTMDYAPTFMMSLALQWRNCPRGNRPTPHSIHCTLLQRSWRLGSWHRPVIMPSAWMLIERSIGATLCQQEGWWPWRRKEWHQPIPPLGRTPSQ